MKKLIALAAAVSAAAAFTAGCTEVAQGPGKGYAGKEDTKPYAGDEFKGDKAKWESALAQRSQDMNEYNRVPLAKK
jgi:predicted small secreted protein